MLHARNDGRLRILQLTDFHHDGASDLAERTWRDIDRLVCMYRPHLLAVTGDIWCSDETPELGPGRMMTEVDAIGKLGVPWAFCWGNHDWVDDLEKRQAQLAAAPNALMKRGDRRGNVRIEVHHKGRPVWDVFFINSEGEWRPDDHLHWFAEESARIKEERGDVLPALACFHIPLRDYEEARLSGAYQGIAGEEVLCWGDDGSILDQFRAAGNVRLCFSGHSHRNDFRFEKQGITMVSGRCIGYPGYGELKRGATLLDLNVATNDFAIATVFADGSVWRHADAPPAVPQRFEPC